MASPQRSIHMGQQAKGTFEVKRSMEPGCDLGDGVEAGHFRFDKTFVGPLDATSVVWPASTA